MPKPTDKFEMREMNKEFEPIRKGEVLEITDAISEYKPGGGHKGYTQTKIFVMHKISANCSHVVKHDKWEWRYIGK